MNFYDLSLRHSEEYRHDLLALMARFGVRSEAELISGHVERFRARAFRKKKKFEVQELLRREMRELRETYIDIFRETVKSYVDAQMWEAVVDPAADTSHMGDAGKVGPSVAGEGSAEVRAEGSGGASAGAGARASGSTVCVVDTNCDTDPGAIGTKEPSGSVDITTWLRSRTECYLLYPPDFDGTAPLDASRTKYTKLYVTAAVQLASAWYEVTYNPPYKGDIQAHKPAVAGVEYLGADQILQKCRNVASVLLFVVQTCASNSRLKLLRSSICLMLRDNS